MINEFEQVITSNVASIAMAGAFIWYLVRKDERNSKTYEKFNEIISNHIVSNTKCLQELTDAVKSLNGKRKKKVK